MSLPAFGPRSVEPMKRSSSPQLLGDSVREENRAGWSEQILWGGSSGTVGSGVTSSTSMYLSVPQSAPERRNSLSAAVSLLLNSTLQAASRTHNLRVIKSLLKQF